MVKVSVIIPVYNAEKYLRKTLDTVISQTLKDIEIILINDGSTDKSLDICREYLNKDKRIMIIDKENEGVSIARNTGMEEAKGQYITFVDSDDWIELNLCEELYNKAIKEEADIVFCNHIMESKVKSERVSFQKEEDKDEEVILKEKVKQIILTLIEEEEPDKNHGRASFRSPWGKLFKITIINEKNLEFNPKLIIGEDFIFNIEYLKLANKIAINNKYLYHYRNNDESATRKYRQDMWEIYKKLLIYLGGYLSVNYVKDDYINRLNKLKIKYLFICLRNEENTLNEKTFNERRNSLINICKDSEMKSAIKEYKGKGETKGQMLTLFLLKNNMYSIYLLWKVKKN